MGQFFAINSETRVRDVITADVRAILLVKRIQAGKTKESQDLALMFYKTSAIVYLQSKNTMLETQNMARFIKDGFTIIAYRDGQKLGKVLREAVGKKVIVSILMEINNLRKLEDMLEMNENLPISFFVDEADLNNNTISADERKKRKSKKERLQDTSSWDSYNNSEEEDDEEDEDVADGSLMPPVTQLCFKIKNLIKNRPNSRAIFITATPVAILTAEKGDWTMIYKESYPGYVGSAETMNLNCRILENTCPARSRWTGNFKDQGNTFRPAVAFAVEQFVKAPNRATDEVIQQVCLISLENRKIQQFAMAEEIKMQLKNMNAAGNVGVIVMNSDTKSKEADCLASMLYSEKLAGKKKVIVIAGFMASRGVSFTDFNTPDNLFELILQVHYTKKYFPLNSAQQNMRICGPKRRTVGKPCLICNTWAEQDIKINFPEAHRIAIELAKNDCATLGNYNSHRPLAQSYCFRYLKQGSRPEPGQFVYKSLNPADHLPIES